MEIQLALAMVKFDELVILKKIEQHTQQHLPINKEVRHPATRSAYVCLMVSLPDGQAGMMMKCTHMWPAAAAFRCSCRLAIGRARGCFPSTQHSHTTSQSGQGPTD